MAQQHRNGAFNTQNRRKTSNLAGSLAPTASLSHIKHTRSHTKADELPCRYNPLYARLVDVFADKRISWVHRAWKTACNALPKQGFHCVEEVIEPELSLKESSPKVKCYFQGKLEVLPPLERHILHFMSEQSLLQGHVFLHTENTSLHCNCAHTVRPYVDCGNLNNVCASPIGIFLQDYTKNGINLAHKLMEGRWRRKRLHTLAFARLRGEPGMICSGCYHPDMDFDGALEPQLYKESHRSPLSSLHEILPRAFKERLLHPVPQQQQQQ
eukprot:c15170_g3_i1 orf=3-806(-)